ncbi:molybdate ABC transporter substrate-binding protein [Moraxella sp. FZFQ2102]|uniref:molybdate ABC transporter substrate-binding protein n=1 Tax=Moraxella sp. FZFQ2102 TaxID=2953752 RepID=UPI00209C1D02|nr:molybdate ABC transporter substrate-binding protein [Moraxella sp. FZFQ2102]USZ14770.1 molybdate ABC transporter substrate-binding protein [Moraxella sp. FZFQ2102]
MADQWVKTMARMAWMMAAMALAACTQSDGARDDGEDSLTVFAPASLANAIDEINAIYQAQNGISIHTSYASSGTLAKQIENHAPADVFISADTAWMVYLADKKALANQAYHQLLSNRLVLITPKNHPTTVPIADDGSFDVAVFRGKLCIGNTDSVPAGRYAKQALSHLGMWQALTPKLVETEDVRQALTFVDKGECELGIVYATDVVASDRVSVVARFATDSHDPIIYPVAMVSGRGATLQYVDFLSSKQAQAIYHKYGFVVLP